MILGPVSYLDCLVFVIFLAPQLLLDVGILQTLRVILEVLPFLVIQLPITFIIGHYLLPTPQQPAFVRQASAFEDFVVRCVRYAFANINPKVGRVFFGKKVALPWLRWRLLRHGYLRSPVHWREYQDRKIKGIWAVADPAKKADIVLYYAHGGGFSMGSAYFYLEFLLSWLSLMRDSGYRNPAVFGIDYTLVPDSCFPTQLDEIVTGYEHVLSFAGDPSRVCVAGDSAGGTLILSLLLHLANPKLVEKGRPLPGASRHLEKPGMAALISPWPTLHSPLYQNNSSDFLDADALQLYASQYAGGPELIADPLASPGNCKDVRWWKDASPSRGTLIVYGKEEVFAPEIEKLVQVLQKAGTDVSVQAQEAGIHAWPVASLFLGDSTEQRLKGLRSIVGEMKRLIRPGSP
ncbi:alpha/beta-hydrolase [Cryphonectria parasitica EP155]|uniref:Alpha/beta-hydrolase n=1 Tax=Cryphonectria parasitica (strain ATCC 38755 / EP155) TaxID=660469 RepID=A0A9P5CTZ7_CRYP1|nr:alpha/beta-hydrolase [Cryphonectria parasitica EP155]KAF3770222.1 alpha/beta-hydrolase [Cryphonectria parasitica EP155]